MKMLIEFPDDITLKDVDDLGKEIKEKYGHLIKNLIFPYNRHKEEEVKKFWKLCKELDNKGI